MKKQTRRRRKKSFSYDDALAVLTEAFSSVSIDHSVSALREADGNPDMAAEILVQALADEEPGSTDTGPTSRSRSRAAFLGPIQSRLLPGRVRWRGFESGCVRNLVSERCFRNKQKRVIASAGTVSNVLGEECVRSKMTKLKAAVDNSQEEAEQFLCSMLGDDSDLNLAVIRDLTDKASDCTSYSSEDNIWNYADVLASSEAHCPMSPSSTESNLPQKVLESLFNISKAPEYEPQAMNWKNVVNKLQALGPEFDVSTASSAGVKQENLAKGDEYHVFRGTARQHWDSMKAYYQKAATAFSKGSWEHAGYLSGQGKVQTRMAQKANEKAGQEIFKARNKDIENMITIDLHGQHVKQTMKLLKIHLLFGTYAQSVQYLRVITGGSQGRGKLKLKQSVIELVENEGITWSEENPGVILIKLGSHTEFNFKDSKSDGVNCNRN